MTGATRPTHVVGAVDGLADMLARDGDVGRAVATVLDHLVARGFLMPSIYLARDGRLRCMGQRGYWQVQDGLPFGAGVAGRTYSTGESVRMRAEDAPDFIAAVPDITEEVCVPIRVPGSGGEARPDDAGQVVGILNIETLSVLPEDTLLVAEQAAQAFGRRLSRLGWPPRESLVNAMLRHATALAGLDSALALWQYSIGAASTLTEMSSAVVVTLSSPRGDGPRVRDQPEATGQHTIEVAVGAGPLAPRLAEVPTSTWQAVAEQVRFGGTCYTAGPMLGANFVGQAALRDLGAASIVIVPVFDGPSCRALLVCADMRPRWPTGELIEKLELLVAHVATCLRTIDTAVELRRGTLSDPLTGLGNRAWFLAELTDRLADWTRKPHGLVAVIFADLDGFKYVNDSLGHSAGDELLRRVAARMRTLMHPDDVPARLGGDEFAWSSNRFADRAEILASAQSLPDLLIPSFDVHGVEVAVTASVGVAILDPADPRSAKSHNLLREADTAMYEAKRQGRSRVAMYTERLRTTAAARLATSTALRSAVTNDELVVEYQPVVHLESGRLRGFEALVRWDRPGSGRQTPDSFIHVAEETGAIIGIGRWVLGTACAQLRSLEDSLPSMAGLMIGINLSARQLLDPALPQVLAGILLETGLSASQVVLEITESTLVEDVASSHVMLNSLKKLGVMIAIDDFGTGFSSLSSLSRLPVDILKIDRSFVKELDTDVPTGGRRGGTAIVQAIIALASAMDLDLVAEGVATSEQRSALRTLGCPNGQGYLFAPPMAADALLPFVQDHLDGIDPALVRAGEGSSTEGG